MLRQMPGKAEQLRGQLQQVFGGGCVWIQAGFFHPQRQVVFVAVKIEKLGQAVDAIER